MERKYSYLFALMFAATLALFGCSKMESKTSTAKSSDKPTLNVGSQTSELSFNLFGPNQKITVTQVEGGQPGELIQLASGATVRVRQNGRVIYSPTGLLENLEPGEQFTETITYRATDHHGFSGTFQFSFVVIKDPVDPPPVAEEPPAEEPPVVEEPPAEEEPANQSPVARNDVAELMQNGSILVDALANDFDPEGSSLRITGVSGANNGAASVENNQIRYTPATDFSGTETLTYTITDGELQATAQVSLLVEAIVIVPEEPEEPPPPPTSDLARTYRITRGTAQASTNDLSDWYIQPPGDRGGHGSRHYCHVSHFSYDDPIVYPNQPGQAHLHMFFGNTEANAHSTSDSINNSGNSTCSGGTLNRSSYWVPALFDQEGRVRTPRGLGIYYKSFVADPSQLRPLPRGLQMIARSDVLGANVDPTGFSGHLRFNSHDGLSFMIIFPNCIQVDSNGNPVLTSRNGIDHVAYGDSRCPASHPYMVPTMTINVGYDINFNSNWYLASDSSVETHGRSIHADYIVGWNEEAMRRITQCVRDGNRECNAGAFDFQEDRQYHPDGRRVYGDDNMLLPEFVHPINQHMPKSLVGGDSHAHHH